MCLEIRKPIPEYEEYEVTSWGRILKNGNPIKPEIHEKGYLRVDLWNDNGRKHFKVHRLVAEMFVCNPDNKPFVNHIDGNKKNNSFTNLEWVTDEENKKHAKILRSAQKGVIDFFEYWTN